MKKWNRDKAIVEILRFTYNTDLSRMREAGKLKAMEKLKFHLFQFDIPFPSFESLTDIQTSLKQFFDSYFKPLIDAYHSSDFKWQYSPGNSVHLLAEDLLSTGKVKTYDAALKRISKKYPRLFEIYVKGQWKKVLPKFQSDRYFICDGEFFSITSDDDMSIQDFAVYMFMQILSQQIIPISAFYQCKECHLWNLNTRKSRKHWFCSKKCYDRFMKREERKKDPEKYNKAQRNLYKKKVLASTPGPA